MHKYSWLPLILLVLVGCSSGNQNFNEVDSASNWAMLDFVKTDSLNPVLEPGANSFLDPMTGKVVAWESKNVFNPAIVVRRDTVFMLYRAQDSIGKPGGTSRIGLAYSIDGLHFTKTPRPVFYPEPDAYQAYEWQGGVEDPRIVEDSTGIYYMTYTSYDGKTARLMVASSPDLQKWTKHGPVFANAYGGKYLNQWSKSGSIVSRYVDGKIIATKINGKYWMYWGDQNIWVATSTDLIHWEPFEMQEDESAPIPLKGQALNMPQLRIIIPTRDKKFDSDLVEPGPPAMLTDKGILLIYNSRNLKNIGDTSLADGTYTAGQVLLDKNNPLQVLHRLNHYFMKPERSYELVGEVNNVCFLEGLAQFKNQWFLYYGTADSKIAVAVRKAAYP
ncbi:MAG: glycosidase [Chitinophagaceae bacterium BSSC1]|nr:MAG: glycosidase [Chitinophagaceae bacterium BSSC1]